MMAKAYTSRGLGQACGFGLLGFLLLLGQPASALTYPEQYANSPEHPRYNVCVQNAGGYVAHVWYEVIGEAARNPGRRWIPVNGQARIMLGQTTCLTVVAPFAQAVRVHAAADALASGLKRFCAFTLDPGRPARVYLRGTIWDASCGE